MVEFFCVAVLKTQKDVQKPENNIHRQMKAFFSLVSRYLNI